MLLLKLIILISLIIPISYFIFYIVTKKSCNGIWPIATTILLFCLSMALMSFFLQIIPYIKFSFNWFFNS